MTQRPHERPYWRTERERRFVLDALPDGLDPEAYRRFCDLYIDGTDLRLRRVEAPDGRVLQLKLGQKRPTPDTPDDPRHRRMTTFYLRPEEEVVLGALPGRRSVKRRYSVLDQGVVFCIDVWEQPRGAAGIFLAEVECDSDAELDAIEPPSWAVREVTADPSFSGFVLAGRTGS